jgi:prepilin-type N-terminal cleavage/methylation domain-containing protein
MTPERRRRQAGFSLLELIIALSISSIVLIGVFSMTTSMIQYEVEGIRKGSVNGWSLASLMSMNREIENSSVLVYPISGAQDFLVVCDNWSRLMNGGAAALTASQPTNIYQFCYDSSSNVLRRETHTGNCPGAGYAPPACSAGSYNLLATGVYRDTANDAIFTVDGENLGTIRLRYIVGKPTTGAAINEGNGVTNFANPQSMAFDTRLSLSKAMGAANTGD